MSFEWDDRKAARNLKKHAVDFADAVAVFFDERAVTKPDPTADEERFVTLGEDGMGRLLAVVYTWRNDTIRIISARKATRGEVGDYEG